MQNESMSWLISNKEDPNSIRMISQGVTEYGRQFSTDGNAEPLNISLFLDSILIAGAIARTEYQRLFVSYLWVDTDWRGTGLGKQILERLEEEAKLRGCKDALIETLLDPIANFYEKQGYRPWVTIPNYVGNFTRHILLKHL
ncbi:GNAT family N-acetyltransferase [Leeia sp. TBRC 13508]|uniref:GNAT family N-acetyltransferase n=1 Tax=Leeia speluncae TaxID=2884804 RepID=A0ABS8DAH7_9NEIS|nr:GNAT family N-acetyltransferase [Leeia speluncae]MCB6185214.1 GNAT family N-acetyltransferase [Leeia speluncae]